MLSVLPFNNTVDRIEVTGAALLQVLEWNLAGLCPDQSCDPAEFFQVSGARLNLVVTEENAGARLASVQVRREDGDYVALQEEEIYSVAITSFLTLPGKSPIGPLIQDQVRGPSDYEALVKYIQLHSPLHQTIEGRINIKYIK